MSEKIINYLNHIALNLRINAIKATTASKSGHPTSCMSAADVIAALFFHIMKHDINQPHGSNNDRFILSKGHAIPIVYAAYKELGIISEDELLTLRHFDSELEGHPTPRFSYNQGATGSLGQGLGIGVGMALHAKKRNLDFTTYVMMGDGEIAEGSIWEAAELASHYKLNNIVAIVDANRLAQSGTSIEDHDVEIYAQRFEAFGWETIIIDGHDMDAIISALETTRTSPLAIIAKTYKGYGLEEIENKNGYHGKPFKQEEVYDVITILEHRFKDAVSQKNALVTKPQIPQKSVDLSQVKPERITVNISDDKNTYLFQMEKSIATRHAFGYALSALGRASEKIMVIDADVKNSTYTDIFEKEFPDRFIQCYIAEQNMASVATGLEIHKNIPFFATFAAFITRAHDQIRMAGIGRNALRICGSHAGVSIGEDGPSQMGLEDLAMMRCIPNSIVLYPSDGVSTYKLTQLMANYHDGISYLRTTRAVTPMLYDKKEEFHVGGCKILRQSNNDLACIVAAGITLHEALKAHKLLAAEGVHVSVIDAYSIKPLDVETIKTVAKLSGNKIITVEDHYPQGGLGEAVAHGVINRGIIHKVLAVNQISRSGTPEMLMKHAEIDAESIVLAVQSII